MCKLHTVLGINVILFSLIGILHLLRAAFQWNVDINGWMVPVWLSVIGVIIGTVMVYFNAKHLNEK